MITHTITPLPGGKFLLKTLWRGEDEQMIVHASELSAEDAYKLADAINSVRPVPSEEPK